MLACSVRGTERGEAPVKQYAPVGRCAPSPLRGEWRGAGPRRRECSSVMAEPGSGVRGCLLQLQEFLSAADRCSAAGASYQLIRGLGQQCVLSAGSSVLGG